jgi:hypothetical protein
MKYVRTWLWKRVKRKFSSPNILVPLLKSLFPSFGPLKDSKSGKSLFDKLAWKQALSVLKTVQLGHASDPPGIQLYYKTGFKDKYGSTLYRCIRGTNSLGGGVHQNLIRKFGFFGVDPELANAMLTEYRLRHDFDVSTLNRLGKEYDGHYDPWLVQYIDLLRTKIGILDIDIAETSDIKKPHIAVEVNPLNYRGSKEVFGICPMPESEMDKIYLFNQLLNEVRSNSNNNVVTSLHFEAFATKWNTLFANGNSIF